jgi:hypothetical protein
MCRCIIIASSMALFVVVGSASGSWQARTVPLDQGSNSSSSPNYEEWRAASANSLAAAGYGLGRTPQLRASAIFGQMSDSGTADPLAWWLKDSGFNMWPANPYRGYAYSNVFVNGPTPFFGGLGNQIRGGTIVNFAIQNGSATQHLSLWGDSGTSAPFNSGQGPSSVIVTQGSDGTSGFQSYNVVGTAGSPNSGLSYNGGTANVVGLGRLSRVGDAALTPLTAASSLALSQPTDVGNGLMSSWLYLIRADDATANVYALDLNITGNHLNQIQNNGQPTIVMNDAIKLGAQLSRDTHFLSYAHFDTSGNDFDALYVQPSLGESLTQLKGAMGFGRIANPGWAQWQPVAEIVVPAGESFTVSGQFGSGTGQGGSIQMFPFDSMNIRTIPEPGVAGAVLCLGVLVLIGRRTSAAALFRSSVAGICADGTLFPDTAPYAGLFGDTHEREIEQLSEDGR